MSSRKRIAILPIIVSLLLSPTLFSQDLAPLKEAKPLTAGGWLFMLMSLAFVWILTLYCFKRVMSEKDESDLTKPPAGLGP